MTDIGASHNSVKLRQAEIERLVSWMLQDWVGSDNMQLVSK